MSILSVVASNERVRVAVDTCGQFAADGERTGVSKVLAIPHINSVIATRGVASVLIVALDMLTLVETFDKAVDVLESHLSTIVARLGKHHSGDCRDLILGPQEVAIAGWSPRADRMVALRFHKTQGTVFATDEVRGLYAAPMTKPFNEEFAAGWIPETDDDLARLGHAQVATGLHWHPELAFGGRLIVADLNKRETSFRAVCDL